MYVQVYKHARAGATDAQIAKELGAPSTDAFNRQCLLDDAVQNAVDAGRADKEQQDEELTSFHDYIHDRLPPKVAEIYDAIMTADRANNLTDRQQALLLLDQAGEPTKQRLFLHALHSCFVLRDACNLVGISVATAEKWARDDPYFAAMVAESQLAKKDFWESRLHRLGLDGNEKAIIHVNKTLNRDRGYGEKVEVTHSGEITNTTTVQHLFVLDDHLDKLSPACRLEILHVMEAAKNPPPIDVTPQLPAPRADNT